MSHLFRGVLTLCMLTLLSSVVWSEEWSEKLSHKTNGVTKLIIFAGPGDLQVNARSGMNEVTADLVISYPGSKGQAEKHVEQKMDRYLRRDGSKLTLKAGYLKKIKKRDKKATIDLVVTMPDNLFLDIRDTDGDISISGLAKGGRVADGLGHLRVERSHGPLTLNDGSGHVSVFDTSGKLKINDLNDDMEIHNHQGELVVNDKKGNVIAESINGQVRISDSSGHIDVKSVKGRVKITNTSGDIQLASIQGNVELKDGRGNIQIRDVVGDLYLKSDKSGKVDIQGVTGDVRGVK
ncbi:hypothetical protein M3P05_12200 [Sansalvadorimonas sp. 2012CJ34-2]|uniref:Adhesin domain-containing protein n=1 Tax=Parendozoicomonas callyspongiae TaxID=2942213 RepID=A0ABT0PJP2_9GAMM|nr:hypothetical protein [Sansalvadorimonas sp. 2012CJ34-2]MCL6270688.1 hypothetical protein [Sansalvadorimonas sp. 2012CJ34-2]